MRACPTCGRDSLRSVDGTRHLECEGCDIVLLHEGNGFVVESR